MAFNDIEGKFKPYTCNEAEDIKIINNEDMVQYPVAYSENLIDPSVLDGVIEPLVIRHAITNNAIDSPFHAHDVRGSIMGGNNNPIQGADLITNDIKLKENVNEDSITGAMENYNPFYDSDEIGMEIESTGILVRTPGYVSDTRNTDVVFDDVMRDGIGWTITLDDPSSAPKDVTLEHARDRQRYNNSIKSAQSGFVYSNNAKVGTDSLAFGGLTRK